VYPFERQTKKRTSIVRKMIQNAAGPTAAVAVAAIVAAAVVAEL
jgi:hypothetical protein